MTAFTHDRPYLRTVGDEPLPGYRLVAPLGQGGFGEVWKCVAPGGLQKAIKFVFQESGEADEESSLRQEYEAFLRVKGIRHPFLLTLERVELIRDELIMVMELADESLAERFDRRLAAGHTGIDRRQLLAYMVDIAEALDVLSGQHGLQHLDIKPANLFLLGGHVKVGDYGLVSRFCQSADGTEPKLGRGLTPKYVAPEILSEKVDGRSDQYSLALVYFELLTGGFPYPGKSARQLLLQHASAEPDLRSLPDTDRYAVGKALSKSPIDRYPTCLAFVRALLNDVPSSATASGTGTLPVLSTRRLPGSGSANGTITPSRGLSSGAIATSNTQRLNPAVTMRPGASAAAMEELFVVCPEFRFVSEARSGPRGRLIRATDPTGAAKAVRVLRLDGGTAADLDALHRALARPLPDALQTVVVPQSRLLAVVSDADAPTLREWLAAPPVDSASQASAAALVAPLAAMLDRLHAASGFAHLLLEPAAVAVSGTAVAGVVGFGVGEALRASRTDTDWIADCSYAAPEAVAGLGGPRADQYSLALLYLTVRRAWLPDAPRPRGTPPRIDWDVLAKDERAAVRRALAANPAERFDTCAAFTDAIRPAAGGIVLDKVRLLESVDRLNGVGPPTNPPPDLPAFAAAVVRLAQAGIISLPTATAAAAPVLRQSDGQYTLRFPVKLSAAMARMKLSAFTAEHGYSQLSIRDGGVLLKPRAGRGGVELLVQLPPDGPVAVTEMIASARSLSLDQGPKAVEQVAAALDLFRRTVQNAEERRANTRWRAEIGVTLYPVDDELAVGAPLRVRTKDVSASGFAVVTTGEPISGHVFAAFDGNGVASGWAALAHIVRVAPLSTPGQHLVACRFTFAGS